MKQREGECKNCGVTDWLKLGFVPAVVFHETDTNSWLRAELCLSCGETKVHAPTQDEIKRAIDGYLEIMEEYDLASEEELDLLR